MQNLFDVPPLTYILGSGGKHYQSEYLQLSRGGISFNTGGSFSISWMWKMSPGRLPCPRTGNNIKKDFFNIPSRKLGKSVNLFHLNMDFFLSQTEKVSRFLIAGMLKLSLDVENEPPV